MRRYRLETKREAVALALRRLVGDAMTKEEALAMRGTGWEGDLDELRSGGGHLHDDRDFTRLAENTPLLVVPVP